MTTYLNREAQFGVKIQAAAGIAETLAATDFSQNSKDVKATTKLPATERARNRGSLSGDPDLGKAKMQVIGTTEEIVGKAKTTVASDALLAHRILLSSGCQRMTIKIQMIAVGAITGLATASDMLVGRRIGNNATEGSATKTGMIVAFKAGKLYYRPGTGSFANADTIYVYDAPLGNMTASADPVDAGFEFRPLSETAAAGPAIATVACVKNGKYYRIADAMGDVTLMLDWNDSAKLQVNYQGPFVPSGSDPDTAAASNPIPNVPAVGGPLAVLIGFPAHVNRVPVIFKQFQLKLGNQLAERPSAGANSSQGSGYAGTRISDRKPTGTMDPEKPDLATEDYLKKTSSRTTFPVGCQIGDPADANGAVIAYVPAAELTGDFDETDRDGVAVNQLNWKCTGTNDDELSIFHIAD